MTYCLSFTGRVGCSQKHAPQRAATVHIASKPHSQQHCRSRRFLRVNALGFDFGDGERDSRLAAEPRRLSPKAFEAYTLRANSLLVYQHVFKGAVGEALLSLIAASQKYQASNKDIVGAYGKFYNLLLLSGYDCFTDYVVDQVLLGRDNPFARAVAQGQVEKNAPILQAVAYDLDTLQGLAIRLDTLADYIGEVAPTAGPYWVSAASATAVRRPSSSKQLPTSGAPAQQALVVAAGGSSGRDFIGKPPTPDELSQYKAAFAGHDHWSAAAALLIQYYSQHGFGVTSRNTALRWSKGGFEEASEGGLAASLNPSSDEGSAAAQNPATILASPMAAVGGQLQSTVVPALKEPYAALAENTRRHCQGLPAYHAVVCGPSGSGKSWLLWEGTLLAGRDLGLRIVDVPPAEVQNILDIARGCARYPRVRFILVADHVDLPLRGAVAQDLMAGLGACGGSGWPSNTLLYIGASATSTVSRSDAVVARCPLVVPVQGLADEAAYLTTIKELLAAKQCGEAADGVMSDELKQAALQFGKQQGVSMRTAALFACSVVNS